MTILSINNVGKAFRHYKSEWQRILRWFGFYRKPVEEHWVIRNVSFQVEAGESIGIIGKNGAGKSTLLKIITQTLSPTEGNIEAHGRVSAILELGMGFNPELTGRQNVYHTAGLMGFSLADIEYKIAEIEAFAEIDHYFDEPMRTYSSGMQMRVAFAVATAWRPDILIIDEALSVGDSYFQAKCFNRINHFKEEGTTLLLVTHSPETIAKHCDRAIFLYKGRIKMDGAPREVINHYLEETYGTEKSSNNLQSKAQTINELVTGSEDLFHTRPGYCHNEHRWGNKQATILDYLITTNNEKFPPQIKSSTHVNFYLKVKFHRDFDSIVPGFLIKTLEGIQLYATNSSLSNNKNAKMEVKLGDTRIYKFSLPLPLGEGDYLISLGISAEIDSAEPIPLDRRYDSILLHINQQQSFVGLTDLAATFNEVESI
jgi:lipopolysaccharide transport system ATP-binding protein